MATKSYGLERSINNHKTSHLYITFCNFQSDFSPAISSAPQSNFWVVGRQRLFISLLLVKKQKSWDSEVICSRSRSDHRF